MDKIQKRGLLFIICFFTLFIFVSQSNAIMGKDLEKAKNFMEDGKYTQAADHLEKAVLENITNAEVHFLLGIAYINNDNLEGADAVFRSAYHLNPDYGYEIGYEYKKIANWSLSRGDYHAAGSFFEKAVEFAPDIGRNEGYDFFVGLGDTTKNAEYYAKSIIYAQGDNQKQKRVAFKVLKLGSDNCAGSKCEDLKEESTEDAVQETAGNAVRTRFTEVVFEKTFTFENTFEKKYGQIKAIKFEKHNIRVDDEIEVIAELMDGSRFRGKEIGVWMGKNYNQNWVKTENGYYTEKIKKIPEGTLIISLAKRKDVKVAVKVKRKIIPEQI
jgi:tetratricopeptide (TPR) repeat protein